MKHRTALAAAALAAALLTAPALAQVIPPAAISVTGEATVSVPPDLAQIDGGVTSEAKTAREASEANNTAMGKVLQALKGAGIEEKDIQTSRLSLQPRGLDILFLDPGALQRLQHLAHRRIVGLGGLARGFGLRRDAAIDLRQIRRHRHSSLAGHGNRRRRNDLRQRGRGEQRGRKGDRGESRA